MPDRYLAEVEMNGSGVLPCIILAAMALQGCASDPTLVSGNKRGGIISNADQGNGAAAATIAANHCRQYGEAARITVVDVIGRRVKFLCTEPASKPPST